MRVFVRLILVLLLAVFVAVATIGILIGGAIFANAKSIMHEMAGCLMWIVAATLLSGAGVITAVLLLENSVNDLRKDQFQSATRRGVEVAARTLPPRRRAAASA